MLAYLLLTEVVPALVVSLCKGGCCTAAQMPVSILKLKIGDKAEGCAGGAGPQVQVWVQVVVQVEQLLSGLGTHA